MSWSRFQASVARPVADIAACSCSIGSGVWRTSASGANSSPGVRAAARTRYDRRTRGARGSRRPPRRRSARPRPAAARRRRRRGERLLDGERARPGAIAARMRPCWTQVSTAVRPGRRQLGVAHGEPVSETSRGRAEGTAGGPARRAQDVRVGAALDPRQRDGTGGVDGDAQARRVRLGASVCRGPKTPPGGRVETSTYLAPPGRTRSQAAVAVPSGATTRSADAPATCEPGTSIAPSTRGPRAPRGREAGRRRRASRRAAAGSSFSWPPRTGRAAVLFLPRTKATRSRAVRGALHRCPPEGLHRLRSGGPCNPMASLSTARFRVWKKPFTGPAGRQRGRARRSRILREVRVSRRSRSGARPSCGGAFEPGRRNTTRA